MAATTPTPDRDVARIPLWQRPSPTWCCRRWWPAPPAWRSGPSRYRWPPLPASARDMPAPSPSPPPIGAMCAAAPCWNYPGKSLRQTLASPSSGIDEAGRPRLTGFPLPFISSWLRQDKSFLISDTFHHKYLFGLYSSIIFYYIFVILLHVMDEFLCLSVCLYVCLCALSLNTLYCPSMVSFSVVFSDHRS